MATRAVQQDSETEVTTRKRLRAVPFRTLFRTSLGEETSAETITLQAAVREIQ